MFGGECERIIGPCILSAQVCGHGVATGLLALRTRVVLSREYAHDY